MDRLTPEQRKKNMQAVKNKDSLIELMLRKELWSRGLRYRKNYTKITGKPDIVFIGKKVAVFQSHNQYLLLPVDYIMNRWTPFKNIRFLLLYIRF